MVGFSSVKKVRFYTSVSAIYALTLVFGLSALGLFDAAQPTPVANAKPISAIAPKTIVVNQGKPVKLVLPRIGLELPIDDGVYDPATNQWTLSGNHAHFALSSVMANDYGGTTFIYGHNHWWVFGKLKLLQPGDELQIHADNGHIFSYKYGSSTDAQPSDLSVFKYDGPPTIVLQTCEGSWNELRRLYNFKFDKVLN